MQVTPSESPPSTTPSKPTSLVELGNVIRARTTDFIAITIIIILGLTVGQQLIFWWQVDKSDIIQNPANQALPLTNWDQLQSPISIQFGDQHELVREEFLGTKEVVFPKIIERVLTYAQNCRSVSTGDEQAMTSWKTALSQFTPVKTDNQGHAIFNIDGPFPLLIGITGFDNSMKLSAAKIVCVAYYAQIQPDHWKLNISRSKNATAINSQQVSPTIPPECQLGLSLHTQTGDSMTQFTGQITLAQCWEHFDTWAEKNNFVDENFYLSPEQQLLQRVYRSDSPIPHAQQQGIITNNQMNPVTDQEFTTIKQKAIKVLIQIRQDHDRLHGMIHTIPLLN